ncbi:glycosyltransferase [Myxosarcina sp. GI1]|uniref:glycosyltransferase n=1 Tax=Myxosarcina sp. GI1 TaxID=1541065 RepID=UPI00055D07FE|nr:glycosyltransferase [Myxosarcina sp. GI1]
MKIAYLINQYPAVSHSFIRREIQALEAEGFEVFRFSIRRSPSEIVDRADKLELAKTRFVLEVGIVGLLVGLLRVAITRPRRFLMATKLAIACGWHKDRGVLVHLAYLAEACVLLGWVTDAGIDRLHAHFAFNPTAVAMLCRVLGGPPYSFTVHGPESIDRAVILSLEEKIKRASFVVAISSYCQSQLYRWCDRQYWSKIHIVRCGLDRSFFEREITPVPETSQLVCVGRLNEQKGHLLLLEAAHQLALEGIKFKLVLVGDGELRAQIESAIARYKLHDCITITGWANNDEVCQQMLNSRATILASFAEGLPVVIMEALALGRPVVSTYIAGIPELVEPEVSGWLVPSGSAAALTKAMRQVLQLPTEQLSQMGRSGAAKVARQHDVAIEAKKLAALFRQQEFQIKQLTTEIAIERVPVSSSI